MKLMIRRVLDGQCDDDAETKRIFAEAFTKPDFTEGTTAFVEKRKPEFK
jgi:enoyl-CoA hydratase/carnithine racemase